MLPGRRTCLGREYIATPQCIVVGVITNSDLSKDTLGRFSVQKIIDIGHLPFCIISFVIIFSIVWMWMVCIPFLCVLIACVYVFMYNII